jgi:hypothetical protein
MNDKGASFDNIDTAKVPLSLITWWVKFFLLIEMPSVGGSEETWKTVLAICPLHLAPSLPDVTM